MVKQWRVLLVYLSYRAPTTILAFNRTQLFHQTTSHTKLLPSWIAVVIDAFVLGCRQFNIDSSGKVEPKISTITLFIHNLHRYRKLPVLFPQKK